MEIRKIAVLLLVVGLVIGSVLGYGVAFFIYQPQISQLQVDLFQTQYSLSETETALSKTESTLSKSQSEAETLREQLTEAKNQISTVEMTLMKAQTNITSLETKLSELETEYATLSSDHRRFKSDIISLIDSLKKKLELTEKIFEDVIDTYRGAEYYPETFIEDLKPYVDAVGDTDLSSIFNRMEDYWEQEDFEEFHNSYADLMETLNWLIQRDLIKLDRILTS